MITVLIALLLAQTSLTTGSLRGVVLNSRDQPLEAARVELSGGPEGSLVTRTDGQGRFAFSAIAPGRYRMSVKKEGYVRQEYGEGSLGDMRSLLALAPGSQSQEFVFRLQPASSIAGIVRNEYGYPIANILIQAFRRTYGVRGNPTITLFSNTLTDDLGAYRLYWIDPGEYFIKASYLPQLPTRVNANQDMPRAPYASTYYPGTVDPANARTVRLKSGEIAAAIDFRLQRSPAVNVHGTVYSAGSRSAAPAMVMVMSPEEAGSTARYQVQTDRNGVFEMRRVNPGSYVLEASTEDGQRGFARIDVLDIDRSGADVVVGPGVTVSARLFGSAPPDADFRGTRVSLLPLDTFIPIPVAAAVQANGIWTLQRVQPGEYALNVSGLPGNAYVSAAQSNGRNVLSQFVQVSYENEMALEIQLAFDGGQISGIVTDLAGRLSADAAVVLVPDNARRARPDQYRIVSSDAEGAFVIRGIPPGDYKLFAWYTVEPNAYFNADFMLNYEDLGIPVQLAADQETTARIRIIGDAASIR